MNTYTVHRSCGQLADYIILQNAEKGLKEAWKAKQVNYVPRAEVGLQKMLANKTHGWWLLLLQARTLMFPD